MNRSASARTLSPAPPFTNLLSLMSDLTPRERNLGLDLVRASAIGMVLLSHACEHPFLPLGWYGVELFFALSGYLIGGILYRRFADGREFTAPELLVFWKRRWYRTLPNYYLALLAFAGLAWVLDGGLPADGVRYPVFLQNLAWPMGGFFLISWSLAIEEWFYLLFPATVLVVRWMGSGFRWAFVTGVVFFVVAPIVLRARFGDGNHWESGMRMVVVFRLDALMYGVALAMIRHGRVISLRAAATAGSVGLAAVGGSAVLLFCGPGHGTPALPALFLALVPLGFALILPLAEKCPRPAPLLTAAVQHTSEWSYSLYLWHMLIYLTARSALHLETAGFAVKLAAKLGCLAVTLVLSALIYRRFELPFIRLRPAERAA